MINFIRPSFEPRLNRMFLQALVVGFATVGLLSGIAPDLSGHSLPSSFFGGTLKISDAEVKATRAVPQSRAGSSSSLGQNQENARHRKHRFYCLS